jgi:hypothetical protein
MTLDELVLDVQNELTFAKALPYSLPEAEIKRQISIAERFFYDNWRHAVQTNYLVIPQEAIGHPLFKANRSIKLPDCVQFVHQVQEAKGAGSLFGTMDLDFADNKFIGSEIFLTPFIGESIMYRTVIFSFLDLAKGFTINTLAFDHNKNTHQLTILGRTPRFDIVTTVAKKIEPQYLYNDELFQRYVRAKCRQKLVELLTTFDYSLPGGIKINMNTITTRADAEILKVEEMLKGENTPDFMFLERF